MGIKSIYTDTAGQVNVNPRRVKIVSYDDLATVTAAGYLNAIALSTFPLYPTDIVDMIYNYVDATNSGDYDEFTVAISDGIVSLSQVPPSGVTLPTIANHIAVYTDTAGNLSEDAATAINGGNIQAGLSGTAGYVASFPSTASKGSLRMVAADNAGNTVTQITNASFGQASVLTIPDPAGAAANFVLRPSALVNGNLVKASGTAGLVADAGARIIANTTGTYAGGGTSNTFAAAGLTVNAKGTAVIRTSTAVDAAIAKAVPGTDTLDITFTKDPGAGTTVDYIYVTASQA